MAKGHFLVVAVACALIGASTKVRATDAIIAPQKIKREPAPPSIPPGARPAGCLA